MRNVALSLWFCVVQLWACGPLGSANDAGDSGHDAGVTAAISDDERNIVAAMNVINDVRLQMQLSGLRRSPPLELAARRHCEYLIQNQDEARCVADAHAEVPGCAGFVGQRMSARLAAAGYRGVGVAEVVHEVGDGAVASRDWIDSVWHRTALLSPWVNEAGYGRAGPCDTMDFGIGAGNLPSAQLRRSYPYDGQIGVPQSFSGRERPVPPAPRGFPVGYPVTLYAQGKVTSHSLVVDATGEIVPHVFLSPDDPASLGLLADEVVMYGERPLLSGTTYRAEVRGTAGAEPFAIVVRFTTR